MIGDLLTLRIIALHEVGRSGEWNEGVAFAAGVDFVVGASVDFRSYGMCFA